MKAGSESRNSKGANNAYTIDELKAKVGPEQWEGVRNVGARNNLQAMKKGDLAFCYAFNGKDPGTMPMELVEEASLGIAGALRYGRERRILWSE
ncbi:hypothetical protein LTR16_004896 [Cryomyces antarcticus]|uniref:EVE domain-containing protein n=1 Tax=Cryomyces antarcticus TaxID=329879 RepID=A0ABR0M632_9PEZI|nr:hypothetical protein LTR39_006120 [Cryomyces antarcticus]KAK5284892.1 hypothetical protein LTR16_004896 [Cryomyces antarcticus]